MRIVCGDAGSFGEKREERMETLRRAARICLEQEGLPAENVEISLSLVDEDEIHDLNSRYRQVDKPTDVLSFPLIDDIADQDWTEEEILLGDVVICLSKAYQQAEEYGHSREREITYLFVHSVLHLLGYDHMEAEDKKLMRAKEERVMDMLGINSFDREQAKELYAQAKKASEKAYAPFSEYSVGAALLTEDGKVYTGVNIENSSFGATICAERTAFVKAISEGERSFAAIAVWAGPSEAVPCGICRQFMYEFAPEIVVITGMSEDSLHIRSLAELLPEGFRLDGGKA